MKNIFVICSVVIFCTCVSNPAPNVPQTAVSSGPDELDIAIREVSNYLSSRIQPNSKVVFLNMQSNFPDLSDYILSVLSENAVNDNAFSVVDRQQLDIIRAELNFQLSGEVSDESAQSIGQMLGAQTIVSGTVTKIGALYRLQVKAIAVQTAAIQGQWSRNIPDGVTIAALTVNQSSGTATTSSTTGRTTTSSSTSTPAMSQNAPATSTQAPSQPPNEVVTPLTIGSVVSGNSLAEKFAWLQRSADSHNTYILEVSTNENIAPHTFEYSGAINITIVLRGDGENRTIRLRSNGTMFTVNANVTFILENNITLHGHNGNRGPMVKVNGGTFIMRIGSTITGNTNSSVDIGSDGGGAVYISNSCYA
jgi:hypothetical protein